MSQLPPPPVSQETIPDLRINHDQPAPDTGPAGAAVLVNALQITGASHFTSGELIAASQFVSGQQLTLRDLRMLARRITDFYRRHGYIVAQSYVPAQAMKDGTVTIAVIEGRYGAVRVDNLSRLHTGVARAVIAGLNPDDAVVAGPLERRLLLLSDIPGVHVNSTLSPGAQTGTSDLAVKLTPAPTVSGNVEGDNEGNPYTGLYQGGGTVNINNPLGLGDMASVRALTSGSGMQYVRGAYQVPVGNATVGAAYAYFHYQLGRQFAALDATGTQQVISGFASYPLIRSYDSNLHVMAGFDHRAMHDTTGMPYSLSDRQANVATLGVYGDDHDTFGGGGWDTYSVYASVGHLGIQTPQVRALDANTAQTQGGYGKIYFGIDRLQTVAGPLSVYAYFRGQVAFHNLDITDKMELGGAHAVRAYAEGEGYGDQGYIGTFEARLRMPPLHGIPGQFQLAGLYDSGRVDYAWRAWQPGPNSERRSGAGVSLTWADNADFLGRLTYAHAVGYVPVSARDDSAGRVWFEIVKYF